MLQDIPDQSPQRKATLKPKVNEHARHCRELYDALMTALRYTAERYGYALAVHGSLSRDIDVVAVPWRESAPTAECLIEGIMKVCEAVVGVARFKKNDINPVGRPHGRKAWAIYLSHLDDGPYLDLSVMPTISASKSNKRRP